MEKVGLTPSTPAPEAESLQRQLSAAEAARDKAEASNAALREEAARLADRLDELSPDSAPPPLQGAPNEMVLRRVFAVSTGACFDPAGASSCLYVQLADDDGYLIYKANRSFPTPAKVPPIYDDIGRKLSVVTPAIARTLAAWERAHPAAALRLGGH